MGSALRKYLDLYCVFFRIGAFTIGGGYVMLPIIQREVSEKKQWATHQEVLDYFALGQSIPGIIAVNTAALVGYKQARIPGAIVAVLGVTTPSIAIIMTIAAFFTQFAENIYVQKAFSGIRAGVTAMLLMAVVKMWKKAVVDRLGIICAIVGFVAVALFEVSPVYMILAGILCGVVLYFLVLKSKGDIKGEDK